MTESTDRALEHLRRLISMGHYPEHSRLPTERQLAEELSMGRGALRRALSVLESEGRITRHVGRGTFVGSGPAAPEPRPVPSVFNPATPAELMEARLAIEPRIAAMAAMRAPTEDVEYLHLCVAKSRVVRNWVEWERWDGTFHRTLALSARNQLLADMVEALNRLRRDAPWRDLRSRTMTSQWQAQLIDEHGRIAAAVANRDPRAADAAMRDHLGAVQDHLFGGAEDGREYPTIAQAEAVDAISI